MVEQDILYKIKIIKTPEGPAPEEVRIKWLGVELLAIRTPEEVEERDFTTMQELGNRGGYMVNVNIALAKLWEVDCKAAAWFLIHVPEDMPFFTFGADEVELILDAEIKKEDL